MTKKRIAVIFGGCSPEYGVSLKSSYSVITHINQDIYDLIMVGITREGEWFHFSGSPEEILADTWYTGEDITPALLSPSRGVKGLLVMGENNHYSIVELDAVMPVLHGRFGEDGTIQGVIEMAGLPIVGCDTAASALCMDKDKSHKLVHAAGIRAPQSITIRNLKKLPLVFGFVKAIGFPLYVKPVKAGSSFGISKVYNEEELEGAVIHAFTIDDEVIVEENIEGFEIGCAIIGSEELIIGEVDEIELSDGFFDFTEKYTLETSAIHCPARITTEQSSEAKKIAQRIYRVLGCRGLARVDMFLTPSGDIIFNEVNTIPGFTPHSRFPKMLQAAGMSFAEVVNTAIRLVVGE